MRKIHFVFVGALMASLMPLAHADTKQTVDQSKTMAAKAEQNRENVTGDALFKKIRAVGDHSKLHQVIPMGGKPWSKAVPLYVFVDPNCLYCHDFISYAVKHESDFKKANVQPIFIPIAFLKASSAGRAATIVKNGWPDLLFNDKTFNPTTEEGGVALTSVKPEFKDLFYAIKDNTDLIADFAKSLNMQSFGTPFMIYKDSRGDVVFLKGMPSPELLNQIIESASELKTVHWDGKFKP